MDEINLSNKSSNIIEYQINYDPEKDYIVGPIDINKHFRIINYFYLFTSSNFVIYVSGCPFKKHHIHNLTRKEDLAKFVIEQIKARNQSVLKSSISKFYEKNKLELDKIIEAIDKFKYNNLNKDRKYLYLSTINSMFNTWFETVNSNEKWRDVYSIRNQLSQSVPVDHNHFDSQEHSKLDECLGQVLSQDNKYQVNLTHNEIDLSAKDVNKICEYCELLFKDAYELRKHISISHSVYMESKCGCCSKFCFYLISSRTKLSSHINFSKLNIENNTIINTMNSEIFSVPISPLFETILLQVGDLQPQEIQDNQVFKEYGTIYDRYLFVKKSQNAYGLRLNYTACDMVSLLNVLNKKRIPTLIEYAQMVRYDGKSTIAANILNGKRIGCINRLEAHRLSNNDSLFFIDYNAFSTKNDNEMIERGQILLTKYFQNKKNINNGSSYALDCNKFSTEDNVKVWIYRFIKNYLKLLSMVESLLQLNTKISKANLRRNYVLDSDNLRVLNELLTNYHDLLETEKDSNNFRVVIF